MWTAEAILETLDKHRDKLRAMGARKIGLFGSYRRGTPTPESDIDILVTLARPSFDDYMDIKMFLEDEFGCKVDLVLENSLKEIIRPYILGEVIYVENM